MPEETPPEAATEVPPKAAKPKPKRKPTKKKAPAGPQDAARTAKAPKEPKSTRGAVDDLIIAEKNIAAKKLATLLTEGKLSRSKVRDVDVYEVVHSGGRSAAVIGLKGHIVELTYPKQYRSWQRVPLQDLIQAEPERTVKEKGIGDALKVLAKGAKRVIIATDFDREGELIGVEALERVLEAAPEGVEVKRARYSSLTKKEIDRAFANLVAVDHNLADSAHARQVVDLAWGAVLTRFMSLAGGQYGADFLSVGRVQSPTLAVLVDREKEIRAFVPTPYWEIGARLRKGPEFLAQHVHGRWEDEAEAQAVHARTRGATQGKVSAVDKRERRESAPEPLNTTAFLAAATRLGMGAARAMNLAEGLYMKGFLSYPRTDNTQYTPGTPFRDILRNLARSEELGHLAERLAEQSDLKPTHGKKTDSAHPPITPTEAASRKDLPPDEWKVYELVTRRFMATLAPPSRLLSIKATFDIRGEAFQASGLTVVEAGWRAYYPYTGARETMLPELHTGDVVEVLGVDLEAKVTQPPRRISQGKLIELMEELGLGTKSTRHEIINKLYGRGYIQNSPPQPAESAFAVVGALESYAPDIAKPDMTAKLESEMSDIEAGRKPLVEVVDDSRKLLAQVLVELEANRGPIGQSIREALREQANIGPCPTCGKGMMARKARTGKRFVGCTGYPACTQTFPLPQRGRLVKSGEVCAACNAPVVKILTPGRRPWVICINMNCPNRGKELITKPIPGTERTPEMPQEPVPEREAEAEGPSSELPTEVEERAVGE